MQLLTALVSFATFCSLWQINEAAKILVIFPFPGPSQYILVQPYLKALAARGHNLTVISAFPQKQKIPNFNDLPITNVLEGYENAIADFMSELNLWQEYKFLTDFFSGVTIKTLQNEKVQQLLRSDEKFDLVIVEALQQEALYAFASHFKAPLIGISTFGSDPNIDELVGNISPVSYIPMVTSGLTDRMNFQQRLYNLIKITMEHLYMWFIYLPVQVQIYHEYFPNPTADLYAVRKNFSLLLLNQHFALSFPRPYVPNAIEVAGFHIQHKPAKLPAEMETFINDAKAGVIYFSLGSNIRSDSLPKERLQILLNVFGALKQRVMWKFENPELPGKPENVFISKWFPQPDILAHPNVKLFITHGGMLSTVEAIFYGKPVVGMPVSYDQFLNVERAKISGIGLGVNFRSFDYDELYNAIMEVLSNPKYTKRAQQLSARFHDQPMKPMDKAIYWTEYVLRHEGAPHMRVAAQDLNFVQVNSLDTAAVLFGGLAAVLLLCIWLLLKVVRCIFGKKVSKKLKQKGE